MNGILLVDKPEGWTSHDVVAKLRGILGTRRIGHSGTLDPLATGLLVCFVGRATRAVQFAESAGKSYVAGLRPGVVTDTQDIEGAVISTSDKQVARGEVELALAGFCGEQMQIPPMYSAVKIKGKKLYEYARKGVEIEREPRQIQIYALRLLDEKNGDYELYVECSKGTYIRTLCHDMGRALGSGAVMSSLRRMTSGDFSVEEAHSLKQIEEAAQDGRGESLLLPVDRLFSAHRELTLNPDDVRRLKNGIRFESNAAPGLYRVYGQDGEFLALGQVDKGILAVIKSFYEV
jgi:tRNA pseudouridine55 synthase